MLPLLLRLLLLLPLLLLLLLRLLFLLERRFLSRRGSDSLDLRIDVNFPGYKDFSSDSKIWDYCYWENWGIEKSDKMFGLISISSSCGSYFSSSLFSIGMFYSSTLWVSISTSEGCSISDRILKLVFYKLSSMTARLLSTSQASTTSPS